MSIPKVSSEIYNEYNYTSSKPPSVDKNSKISIYINN